MGLLTLVFTIAIIGLIVYIITTYIPMPPIFQTVIYVIVAIVLILLLMRVLGVADIPITSR